MQYVRHYGAPAERVFFAPHFVDTDFFRSRSSLGADARLRTREALGIEADEIVVLFVGRLIALKRPADVPRALVGLRGNGRSYRAVFAGAGPLEAEVRETGRRLGVATTLLGFRNQTELPAVYAAADMLVLPSEQETWGLVVNEAMACGLPVVVSDRVGCAPDMVEPGTTGEVFRCGDVAELASAIGRVSSRLGSAAVAEALQRRTQAYSCERACLTALRAIDAVRGQRTYSSRRTD
jgi:glycosyltransferase involved in cell wall biosynthesis